MNFRVLNLLAAMVLFPSVVMPLHAAKAKFLITPLTPTQLQLTTAQTLTVQYKVLNQTAITRTLTMTPINGIQQITTGRGVCSNPFVLQSNASCILTLRLNASQNAPNISGGPVLCKTKSGTNTPDPFLCSQPATDDQLFVTRELSTRISQLSIDPSTLILTSGSPFTPGTITVTNNTNYTATHVAADFTGTVLSTNVTQNASNCTSVAPGASCVLTFTPMSTAVALTSFPIKGDNVKAIGAKISVVNPQAPTLSVTPSFLSVPAGSTGSFTVTNTSLIPAYNISASPLPTALSSAGVTTTGCAGPIAPRSACALMINATGDTNNTAVPSTSITISATNQNSSASTVVGASVAITALNSLSLSPSSLVLPADGTTTGSMTLTNTGASALTNVQANFANTALYGNVSATTCSTIAPNGGKCTMTFTPNTTAVPATNFPITTGSTPYQTVTGTLTLQAPIAYFSNGSASAPAISTCLVSPTTGNLSGCSEVLNNTSLLNTPTGITVNPLQSYTYTANASSVTGSGYSITQCAINSTTGALTGCTLLSDSTFFIPYSVTLNAAGTFAYVVNTNGTISVCPILTNGTFGACTASGAYFNNPHGIAFNQTNLWAYVTNYNGTLSTCSVNPTTGMLSSCSTTPLGTQPYGIVVDTAGAYAYIIDFDFLTLYQCSINAGTGQLSTCITAASGLYSPLGAYRPSSLAINSSRTLLYLAISDMQQVACPITTSGGVSTVGACSYLTQSLSNQYGVALSSVS